jgi:hypothetical protein
MAAGETAWGEGADSDIQDDAPTDDGWEDDAPSDDALDDAPLDGREPAQARAHRIVADDLYGSIPVSRWAQSLLDLPPFRRLKDVSLSDVPGELLFGWPFPSRLTHSLGVYYLTRQARPRDRALQAAALAHDLGHGPFSHLSEPLMIERLGMDHETRSALLLREVFAQARGRTARLLAWLDVDEVTELMAGDGDAGRGALLNGLLDYDNLDNVARFALAAKLSEPRYDGRALARGLRMIAGADGAPRVALADDVDAEATAWQDERAAVYQFLQSDSWNVAAHGMLRKAIDLVARDGVLTDSFFDETDAGALRLMCRYPSSQTLVERVLARDPYTVIWEADAPPEQGQIGELFARWRQRLSLEARIAAEAGLRAHDIVAVHVVSRVARALPPRVSQSQRVSEAISEPTLAEHSVKLLAPAGAGRDYVRRARMAAERALGELGATPRGWPELR